MNSGVDGDGSMMAGPKFVPRVKFRLDLTQPAAVEVIRDGSMARLYATEEVATGGAIPPPPPPDDGSAAVTPAVPQQERLPSGSPLSSSQEADDRLDASCAAMHTTAPTMPPPAGATTFSTGPLALPKQHLERAEYEKANEDVAPPPPQEDVPVVTSWLEDAAPAAVEPRSRSRRSRWDMKGGDNGLAPPPRPASPLAAEQPGNVDRSPWSEQTGSRHSRRHKSPSKRPRTGPRTSPHDKRHREQLHEHRAKHARIGDNPDSSGCQRSEGDRGCRRSDHKRVPSPGAHRSAGLGSLNAIRTAVVLGGGPVAEEEALTPPSDSAGPSQLLHVPENGIEEGASAGKQHGRAALHFGGMMDVSMSPVTSADTVTPPLPPNTAKHAAPEVREQNGAAVLSGGVLMAKAEPLTPPQSAFLFVWTVLQACMLSCGVPSIS
jgi:hypothetical protein